MNAPRGLLIQDASDYLIHIENALNGFLGSVSAHHLPRPQLIQWVVQQQLEEVYDLYTVGHLRNDRTHDLAYNAIRKNLRGILPLLTSQYIKAPQLDTEDRDIVIEIRWRDLYIWHTGSQQKLPLINLTT
jgi:hypothetical protein